MTLTMRVGILVAFVCAAIAVVALAQPQPPALKRIALLIGNQSYNDKVGRLTNPHIDVDRLKEALSPEFEVIVKKDRTIDQLDTDVSEFQARLKKAGPNTVAFVYFSGHGAADDEGDEAKNYLIPVDYQQGQSLRRSAFALAELFDKLRAIESKARIVVVDACRNKAYEKSIGGAGKGLAAEETPSDMLMVYATRPGRVAIDSGVFAVTLAEEISRPGEVGSAFKRVQRVVAQRTRNSQVPELRDQLLAEGICFKRCSGPETAASKQYDPGLNEYYFWIGCCREPKHPEAKRGATEYLAFVKNGVFSGQYSEMARAILAGSPVGAQVSFPNLPRGYTVGKVPTSTREMPWFVHLQSPEGKFVCGGTIISSEWVLTGGGCGKRLLAGSKNGIVGYATIGIDRLTDPSKVIEPTAVKIVDVKVAPTFDEKTFKDDIAVARLARPWAGPTSPLSGQAAADPKAGIVGAFGLGMLSSAVRGPTNRLHAAWMPIVDANKCRQQWLPRADVGPSQVCAGYDAGGADSCSGDSGGPLVAWSDTGPYQIGITSFGPSTCGAAGKAGVYTKVSAYVPWIQRVTGAKLNLSKGRQPSTRAIEDAVRGLGQP